MGIVCSVLLIDLSDSCFLHEAHYSRCGPESSTVFLVEGNSRGRVEPPRCGLWMRDLKKHSNNAAFHSFFQSDGPRKVHKVCGVEPLVKWVSISVSMGDMPGWDTHIVVFWRPCSRPHGLHNLEQHATETDSRNEDSFSLRVKRMILSWAKFNDLLTRHEHRSYISAYGELAWG